MVGAIRGRRFPQKLSGKLARTQFFDQLLQLHIWSDSDTNTVVVQIPLKELFLAVDMDCHSSELTISK